MMVSSGVGAIVLAGVLSAVLMISRSGYLLNNYIEMEKQARNALETFAIDARMTESVTWTRKAGSTDLAGITLNPPDGNWVSYTYDSSARTLARTDKAGTTRVLVSGIESLAFTAYKYSETAGLAAIDPSITSDALLKNDTKMVQISLSAIRTQTNLAAATNNVVSARYVLRNKPF